MNLLVQTSTKRDNGIPLLRLVERPNPPPAFVEKLRTEIGSIHNTLTDKTPTKSLLERSFKEVLLEMGLTCDYEPYSFIIGKFSGQEVTYTPDFVTALRVGDRQVIIEPHGFYYLKEEELAHDLRKFSLFRSMYKNRFYLILAGDMPKEVIKFRTGTGVDQLSDQYWNIPNFREADTKSVTKRYIQELLLRYGKA